MRPVRLEVRGFTSFRESAVVDFTGRRLFVITGPTGAGKSSLLDAMIWALYGQVPRVGNATRQLITHGEQSMSVRFDFTARGQTYRVSRHVPGAAGARLERLTEAGEWHPLADRARDVTAQVTEILGLDYQTFTRTIVLPQGAFDAFLRGDERDRRAILTRLLGLDTYVQAGHAARARARTAEDVGAARREQLGRLELATPEALAAIEAERAQLEGRVADAGRRRERLAALGEFARAAAEAGRALAAAREDGSAAAARMGDARLAVEEAERALATAEQQSEEIAAARGALGYNADEHRRLREIATLAGRLEEARVALEAADAVLAEEQEAATEASREASAARRRAEASAQACAAAVEALAAAAGRAHAAARHLGAAAAGAEAARAGADGAATAHERRAQRLEALAREAETAAEERERAGRVAEQAVAEHEAAAAAREASGGALATAEQRASECRAAHDHARVRHAAVALREGLAPGDPCPVCGEPVGRLPAGGAPDLDEAASAVAEAEFALEQARAAHEQRGGHATRAATDLGHAERAVEQASERLATLDRDLAAAEVDRAGVVAAVAAAQEDARAAHLRASEQQRRGEQARAAERELSLLLAAVPDEIDSIELTEPSEADDKDGEAGGEQSAVALAALGEALPAHERAAAAARDAEAAAREAGHALGAAGGALDRARTIRERVAQALDAAERRMRPFGDSGERDIEQIEASLAALDRAADRARELDDAARRAEAGGAAAAARRDERRDDLARAAELAEQRNAAVVAAGEREQAAQARFEQCRREQQGLDAEADERRIAALLDELEREGRAASQALGAVGERMERARREAAEAADGRRRIAELDRAAGVAGALEQELRGDRFIAYVQQEALRVLAEDASRRLRQLTSGRYRLVIDGNEFAVVDGLNGDEQRSVKTLSGGETFLASLALSLALSERLPELAGTGGAVSLESLFLDEGFGSLDAESLDVAIAGLEALAGEQRMVGVISHVLQLAERLPDGIEVVKTDHTSLVRNESAAAGA